MSLRTPTVADSGRLEGARILIVEDNALIAFDMADSLEEAKASTTVCASVADALAMLDGDGRFDAAVLDVNLPDGIVTPVAERLFARHVPMLFCTGVSLPAPVRERFPEAPVFMKPGQTTEIIGRLAAILGR